MFFLIYGLSKIKKKLSMYDFFVFVCMLEFQTLATIAIKLAKFI